MSKDDSRKTEKTITWSPGKRFLESKDIYAIIPDSLGNKDIRFMGYFHIGDQGWVWTSYGDSSNIISLDELLKEVKNGGSTFLDEFLIFSQKEYEHLYKSEPLPIFGEIEFTRLSLDLLTKDTPFGIYINY